MTELGFYLAVFLGIGVFFLFIHLVMGRFLRPVKPEADKLTIYECGEPTIGSAWIQFDLRYYVVALLFVIFDVEVAFFFPWAVVFGNANTIALEEKADTRLKVTAELVPSFTKEGTKTLYDARKSPVREDDDKDVVPTNVELKPIEQEVAKQFAWIAMLDIGIFFGVLLVGFAYLWKRGDIDWVRSTLAERQAMAEAPAKPSEQRELVGASVDTW